MRTLPAARSRSLASMTLAGVPALVAAIQEAHDWNMPKTEPAPMYACMMPKSDLRFVQQPHDERVVITRHPLRRTLAKLTRAVRL
jgi:hypothetical protein